MKDTDWVSKAVAAVYCGCSEPELDRRIRTKTIGGLLTLAKKRETKRPRKRDAAGDLISGNITERQFKMSAVKRIKNTRVSHRKGGAAEPVSVAAKGRPLTLKAALKNGALVLTLRKAMLDSRISNPSSCAALRCVDASDHRSPPAVPVEAATCISGSIFDM